MPDTSFLFEGRRKYMHFTKMHGAGNDFILLENMDLSIPFEKLSILAKRLCTRRLSIGADGMMVLQPSDKADFRMLFFNSDGSIGEMCGNGARCICRYGYEHGFSGETQVIETTAGIVTGKRISKRLYQVCLNDPSVIRLDFPVKNGDGRILCDYLELGDPGIPHAIVHLEGFGQLPEEQLRALGKSLRWAPEFEKGANVTFWQSAGDDRIIAKTFERGVEDFTYACGTGCGSLVSALYLHGIVSGNNVHVNMPGGELCVSVSTDGPDRVTHIELTGPTDIVAQGEILDEDLVF